MMNSYIKLIIIFILSFSTILTLGEDVMIREMSRRTMFRPNEEASFEWRLSTRGDGEDFVALVRNGEFTINSCGPFLTRHLLDTSGLNTEGSFTWTLPSSTSRPLGVSEEDAMTMSLESSCVESCPVRNVRARSARIQVMPLSHLITRISLISYITLEHQHSKTNTRKPTLEHRYYSRICFERSRIPRFFSI